MRLSASLRSALSGSQVQFTKHLVPALIDVIQWVAQAGKDIRKFFQTPFGQAVLQGIANVAKRIAWLAKTSFKAFMWMENAALDYWRSIDFKRSNWDIGKLRVQRRWNKIKGGAKAVLHWFKTAWRDIGDFLVTAVRVRQVTKIIDFINLIIKAHQHHSGCRHRPISHLAAGQSAGQGGKREAKGKKGGGRQAGGLASIVPGMGSGDKVHMQAMVEPGEGIFVMNRNAMSALQAANDAVPRFIGGGPIPRMDVGGFIGNTPIAKGINSAGDLIGKLPSVGDLPGWIQGAGTFALERGQGLHQGQDQGPVRWHRRASANIAGVKGAGIIAVGRMLQAAGYQVGEHPAFGGVTGVHTAGSAHYRAGAIDVNHDQGNEMAWLDRAAKQLLKINHSQIIWRNHDLDTGAPIGGHMDHLHFAMQRGGVLPRSAKGGHTSAAARLALDSRQSNYNLNEAATILWQAGLTQGRPRTCREW